MDQPRQRCHEADLRVAPDAEGAAAHAAAMLGQAAGAAIEARGAFHLALPGGRTPLPLYRRLAAARGLLDWRRVHVWFGDERAVPWDHPESNYRLAREALLDHVPVPPGQVHPIRARVAYIRQDAAASIDRTDLAYSTYFSINFKDPNTGAMQAERQIKRDLEAGGVFENGVRYAPTGNSSFMGDLATTAPMAFILALVMVVLELIGIPTSWAPASTSSAFSAP